VSGRDKLHAVLTEDWPPLFCALGLSVRPVLENRAGIGSRAGVEKRDVNERHDERRVRDLGTLELVAQPGGLRRPVRFEACEAAVRGMMIGLVLARVEADESDIALPIGELERGQTPSN